MEHWKNIDGYKGVYQVSNLGRVKRVSFTQKILSRWGSYYTYTHKEIIKKPQKWGRYFYISLRLQGRKQSTYWISRLVAKAFIKNPHNNPCVNHVDGNPSNNCCSNLEWVTYSENTTHAYKLGLMKMPYGEKSPAAKLSRKQVITIKQYLKKKTLTQNEIAKKFKIDQSTVSLINTGKIRSRG